MEEVWRPFFFLDFLAKYWFVYCKKYIQTLVRRNSSDFKTLQSSLKNTRLRLVFSTPLGVWKSEEVLPLVFELFEGISADKMLSLQYNRIKQCFV